MKNSDFILYLLPVLFPVFYSVTDEDGNELVFLDHMSYRLNNLMNRVSDKTATEAFQNHFHLFGKQKESNKVAILEISTAISK